MNHHSAPHVIGLDVGGVLYYDEPFELAWLQGVLELTDVNVDEFCKGMRDFYLNAASPRNLFTPAGTRSWNTVRSQWSTHVQPISGALAAVDKLADRYEVCVIANQPAECLDVLHGLGIMSKSRVIVLDALAGHSKPSPEIYLQALAELGRTPERLLMVGDRPEHDATPAIKLGARAVVVQPDNGWRPPPGIDQQLLTEYREVRCIRNDRARAAAEDLLSFPDLASVANDLVSGSLVEVGSRT